MPWVKDGKTEVFEWPRWPAGEGKDKPWEWMQRVMVDYCRLYRECGFKACQRKHACATPDVACFRQNEALLRKHVLPGLLKAIHEAYDRTHGLEPAPLYDPDQADVARDRRRWEVRDGEVGDGEDENTGGAKPRGRVVVATAVPEQTASAAARRSRRGRGR